MADGFRPLGYKDDPAVNAAEWLVYDARCLWSGHDPARQPQPYRQSRKGETRMTDENTIRIAILYPGNEETRHDARPDNNRFSPVFQALADLGVQAEPAVYHDDFCAEVRQQLMQVDGVLVWVNPIEGGRDRTILDAMLREVAATGVFVSAHPDIILKMGTKEVLYQ